MLKTFAGTVSALLCLAMLSCNRHSALTIEPISKEFNERFLTGEMMESGYFSTKNVVQYYQVSNFGALSPKNLLAKLSGFTSSRYDLKKMDTVDNLTVFFYRKRMFVDYSDHLYESARDNENRTLEGYSNDLMAYFTYERLTTDLRQVKVHKYLFPTDDHKSIERTDTITVN